MIFLDSSALAKAYVEEEGTDTVHGVLTRMSDYLFVSDFVALEVLVVLRNQLRHGPKSRYQKALSEFASDYPGLFNLVDVDETTRRRAKSLTLEKIESKARAMDVLHVASALKLQKAFPAQEVTVASSDRDLLDLARSVGLGTFDPRIEPLAALPKRPP
ncbi:MAG TPA: type II toxin-antitoxin system VapC family toxin [Longimicrobium sp.]